jgi:hypothetical protein
MTYEVPFLELKIGSERIRAWEILKGPPYTLSFKEGWIFQHLHFENGEYTGCYEIKKNKCKKCKMKFPPYKSLMLAIRLLKFEQPNRTRTFPLEITP